MEENCEMIWEIHKTIVKRYEIWKKSKLNSEKTWKHGKKSS